MCLMVAVLLLGWHHRVLAADAHDCALALVEANKSYESGNFDQVLEVLKPCLNASLSAKEKVAIYRLMAMTYLATDYVQDARGYVTRLLAIKPNYETTLQDPPQFVRLVADIN